MFRLVNQGPVCMWLDLPSEFRHIGSRSIRSETPHSPGSRLRVGCRDSLVLTRPCLQQSRRREQSSFLKMLGSRDRVGHDIRLSQRTCLASGNPSLSCWSSSYETEHPLPAPPICVSSAQMACRIFQILLEILVRDVSVTWVRGSGNIGRAWMHLTIFVTELANVRGKTVRVVGVPCAVGGPRA
jgi:hypothetical protein